MKGSAGNHKMIYHVSIVKDPMQMKQEELLHLFHEAYWAKKRSIDVTKKIMRHSICYGMLDEHGKLVGFARVVTDHATMFYLCDFIISESYRGHGLGSRLITYILEDKELSGLSGMLVTEYAHGFYEQFGFVRSGERFMLRAVKPV